MVSVLKRYQFVLSPDHEQKARLDQLVECPHPDYKLFLLFHSSSQGSIFPGKYIAVHSKYL